MRTTWLWLTLSSAALALGCCKRDKPSTNPAEPAPSGVGDAAESSELDSPGSKKTPARCKPIGRDYEVGPGSGNSENLDNMLPFATEVGRGVAYESGYAVGALRQAGQSTQAVVVSTNRDGSAWATVELATAHGDTEAPTVFASGARLGVAMLVPAGASRHLRIGRIERGSVQWQAELVQGTDESLAYDVAVGPERMVAVWDDIPKDRKVSAVCVSTLNPTSFDNPSACRVVTLPGTDADMPRVIVRPGGFWLLWIARRPQQTNTRDDNRYLAEEIPHQWLEALPLDQQGGASGSPLRLTPRDGHAKLYDVVPGADGSAIVYLRDDDTPSGSSGGELQRIVVGLGAVEGPEPVGEDGLGEGTPNLTPGWLAIASTQQPTGLGPLGDDGKLLAPVATEPSVGAGVPVASWTSDLLIARPDGMAARLSVLRCKRPDASPPPADAAPEAAP